nr:sigma factor [Pseudalkalibacillus hwajinpoensis]
MIALWECVMNYRDDKGSFSAYAYLKIRGKLLDERRKEIRTAKKLSLNADWSEHEEVFCAPHPNDPHTFHLTSLTINQRKWVDQVLLKGHSLKSVAAAEGVSVEAVKSWRKSALVKLRKQGATSLST